MRFEQLFQRPLIDIEDANPDRRMNAVVAERESFDAQSAQTGGFHSSVSDIWSSIGTEHPIPEDIDHREIAVRVSVMSEVKPPLAFKPCEPLKPRALYVIFLVERRGRKRTPRMRLPEPRRDRPAIRRMYTPYQKHRNEEEGRIVAFIAEVRP